MTDWLEGRRPTPPEDLLGRLGPVRAAGGPELVNELVASAVTALDRVRAAPGRVRESGLELLVADALFTDAYEAALELPDVDDVLAGIVQRAAEPR